MSLNPFDKPGRRLGAAIADFFKLGDKPPTKRRKRATQIKVGPVVKGSPKSVVQRRGQRLEQMIEDLESPNQKRDLRRFARTR